MDLDKADYFPEEVTKESAKHDLLGQNISGVLRGLAQETSVFNEPRSAGNIADNCKGLKFFQYFATPSDGCNRSS